MRLDANKMKKLLKAIKESKENLDTSSISPGLVVSSDEGLKYTIIGKKPSGLIVKYYTVDGDKKIELIPKDEFEKMFKKTKKKNKKKVVKDDD